MDGRPGGYKDPTKIDALMAIDNLSDRRKKFLPDTLAETFQEAVNDPELLALRDDLALLEVRLGQLIRRGVSGESDDKWDKLSVCLLEIETALEVPNILKAKTAIRKIYVLISDAEKDRETWKQIYELLELRRKTTESEANRLVRLNQMISAEDAYALIDRILQAVKRNVRDPKEYSSIAYEVAIATGAAHSEFAPGGVGQVQPDQSISVDSEKLLDSGTQGSDRVGELSDQMLEQDFDEE